MNNPSTLIFLGLAVVWAIVLLPEGIKRLSKVRRSDSIRSFNHQLSVLDRSGSGGRRRPESTLTMGPLAPTRAAVGRHGVRPASSNIIDLRDRRPVGAGSVTGRRPDAMRQVQFAPPVAVRRRRQEVTAVLSAAAVLSLLCVVAFGPVFLIPHLVADALLIGYLLLVAQANKNAQANRALKLNRSTADYSGPSVTRVNPVDLRAMPRAVSVPSARSSI